MKVVVVIPAYNEASIIGKVLSALKNEDYTSIIVVDDGSHDETRNICLKNDVMVLRHVINRGLGGALRTGIQGALKIGAEIIVTFDADGQHNPNDIKKLIKPIQNKEADFVIGSRLMDSHGMPLLRRFFNVVGNLVTFILFGIYVSDSQSGLRAFSREAALNLDIKTNRMEVSSEIIREIKEKNLYLQEVPIKAIYTSYSLSKGQNLMVGIKTFLKLVLHRLMP